MNWSGLTLTELVVATAEGLVKEGQLVAEMRRRGFADNDVCKVLKLLRSR